MTCIKFKNCTPSPFEKTDSGHQHKETVEELTTVVGEHSPNDGVID